MPNRDEANAILARIRKAIAAEFGSDMAVSVKGSFSDTSVSARIEIIDGATPSDQREVLRRKWNRFCGFFDLRPEQFDKGAVCQGMTCQITDINPAASKFPIVVRDPHGKLWKVQPGAVIF